MIFRVCAWHRKLAAPQRWFRLIGIRQWKVVWRFSRSHGLCRGCVTQVRAGILGRRLAEAIAYANASPSLRTLLRDLDLLPERVAPGTPEASRMVVLITHWRRHDAAQQAEVARLQSQVDENLRWVINAEEAAREGFAERDAIIAKSAAALRAALDHATLGDRTRLDADWVRQALDALDLSPRSVREIARVEREAILAARELDDALWEGGGSLLRGLPAESVAIALRKALVRLDARIGGSPGTEVTTA